MSIVHWSVFLAGNGCTTDTSNWKWPIQWRSMTTDHQKLLFVSCLYGQRDNGGLEIVSYLSHSLWIESLRQIFARAWLQQYPSKTENRRLPSLTAAPNKRPGWCKWLHDWRQTFIRSDLSVNNFRRSRTTITQLYGAILAAPSLKTRARNSALSNTHSEVLTKQRTSGWRFSYRHFTVLTRGND